MPLKVSKRVDNTTKIDAAVRALTKTSLLVGVPALEAERSPDPHESSGPSNADLAAIHENGAPEAGIPARPFIHPAVESMKDEISDRFGIAAEKALAGDKSAVVTEFEKLGLKVQAAMRNKITDGPFVPLKPATLAERRRRGRTGDKPLLDTGQLRNSLNYVVRSK